MAAKNVNFNLNTRKKFTVDGDENNVIELDTSDIGIVTRLNESMKTISEIEKKQERLTELAQNEDSALDFTALFAETERDMRGVMDYVFDSPVSDAILGNSSIFSPVGDKYKFEQILDTLLGLYEADIRNGAARINKANIRRHTAKYTGNV